jgi:hypothetical protein
MFQSVGSKKRHRKRVKKGEKTKVDTVRLSQYLGNRAAEINEQRTLASASSDIYTISNKRKSIAKVRAQKD